MVMWEETNWENKDTIEHDEKRENTFVPVRCKKPAQEEVITDEPVKDEVYKIPRRWHIY